MDKTRVTKEELLHIAELSDLKLKDDEIDGYLNNLEEILNFANIVNNADASELEETIGINENFNVFRKDEVEKFEDIDVLLENAPEKVNGMFGIPKLDARN